MHCGFLLPAQGLACRTRSVVCFEIILHRLTIGCTNGCSDFMVDITCKVISIYWYISGLSDQQSTNASDKQVICISLGITDSRFLLHHGSYMLFLLRKKKNNNKRLHAPRWSLIYGSMLLILMKGLWKLQKPWSTELGARCSCWSCSADLCRAQSVAQPS